MTVTTHYNQICRLLCRMRANPKRHALAMGGNASGFYTYTVPRKMMRNGWSSYAVISFLATCNGYHFDPFGQCEKRHRVGYCTRGVVAAIPANKNPFKLDSAFMKIGNDQDLATRSQQSGLDHGLLEAVAFRASLRKDCQIEPSRSACKDRREPDRCCGQNHRFGGEALSLPRFMITSDHPKT